MPEVCRELYGIRSKFHSLRSGERISKIGQCLPWSQPKYKWHVLWHPWREITYDLDAVIVSVLVDSYHGEKLQAFSTGGSGVPAAKKSRKRLSPDKVFISTIYDDAETTDPPDTLLRRRKPTSLKYRPNTALQFRKADAKQ